MTKTKDKVREEFEKLFWDGSTKNSGIRTKGDTYNSLDESSRRADKEDVWNFISQALDTQAKEIRSKTIEEIKSGLLKHLNQRIIHYQENAWRYNNEPEMVVRHTARVHEAKRGMVVDLRNELEAGLLNTLKKKERR